MTDIVKAVAGGAFAGAAGIAIVCGVGAAALIVVSVVLARRVLGPALLRAYWRHATPPPCCPRPARLRLRLQPRPLQWAPFYTPRRGLWLTDTPRPDCPTCEGAGGWSQDFGDPYTGEYADTEDVLCPCWSGRAWLVLPIPRLPRLPRRRRDGGPEGPFSDEPPF